jgi:hypothetical protein
MSKRFLFPAQPLKRYYFDYFGDAIAPDEEGGVIARNKGGARRSRPGAR